MSESQSIRLVTAGVVFSAFFLPGITVDHPVTTPEISLLSPADGDGPPAFSNHPTLTLLSGGEGHLLFKSAKEEPIPSSVWSQRERRGQHLPVALVESEQTITEKFRQQATRPAKGTGGKP